MDELGSHPYLEEASRIIERFLKTDREWLALNTEIRRNSLRLMLDLTAVLVAQSDAEESNGEPDAPEQENHRHPPAILKIHQGLESLINNKSNGALRRKIAKAKATGIDVSFLVEYSTATDKNVSVPLAINNGRKRQSRKTRKLQGNLQDNLFLRSLGIEPD
ncbi:MAG: hypothetical protein KGJ13_03310 [Patescibacteria group bacterium]|nr:hypothetical protein [Patescibacteria group bacterium]